MLKRLLVILALLMPVSAHAFQATWILALFEIREFLRGSLGETKMLRDNIDTAGQNITGAINAADKANQFFLDGTLNHMSQMRGTLEKGEAQQQALFDTLINQTLSTARQQVAANSDVAAARSTRGSIPANACITATEAERLGSSLKTNAQTRSAMMKHGRQRIESVSNPALDIPRILAMKDVDRVPEFVGADAGTMGPKQMESYLNFIDATSPTPPRKPSSLPDAYKGTPQARQYEADFVSYEAAQLLYHKNKIRDGMLGAFSIEVTPTQLSAWEAISKGQSIPQSLRETADGAKSEFPDHWAGLVPSVVGGRSFISERDFLRTEIFRRYANPEYQGDGRFGLASAATPEALLKEYIQVESLGNRMVFEIMNANLHIKQMLALRGSRRVDATLGETLRSQESDLLKN